jgi:hypothetical protein
LSKNKGPKKPLAERVRCQRCSDTGLVLATSRTGPKRKGWEFARVPCSHCAAGKLEADRRTAQGSKVPASPKSEPVAASKPPDDKAFRKNWNVKCMNCDERPTVGDTELCGPCCFGEAETKGGNW